MATKFYCDRCGEEAEKRSSIVPKYYFRIEGTMATDAADSNRSDAIISGMTYCAKCWHGFVAVIRAYANKIARDSTKESGRGR